MTRVAFSYFIQQVGMPLNKFEKLDKGGRRAGFSAFIAGECYRDATLLKFHSSFLLYDLCESLSGKTVKFARQGVL